MRYFVTGDQHQQFSGLLNFIDKMELEEDNGIIVLGDMGLFWRNDKAEANEFIKYYEDNYKCRIYFLRGNHENHRILNELPRVKDNIIDDKVGYISPHIKYLLDGGIYNFNSKKCLVMRRC